MLAVAAIEMDEAEDEAMDARDEMLVLQAQRKPNRMKREVMIRTPEEIEAVGMDVVLAMAHMEEFAADSSGHWYYSFYWCCPPSYANTNNKRNERNKTETSTLFQSGALDACNHETFTIFEIKHMLGTLLKTK